MYSSKALENGRRKGLSYCTGEHAERLKLVNEVLGRGIPLMGIKQVLQQGGTAAEP